MFLIKQKLQSGFKRPYKNDPSDKFAQEGLARTRSYLPIQAQPSTDTPESSKKVAEDEDKVSIDASGTGFVIDKRG